MRVQPRVLLKDNSVSGIIDEYLVKLGATVDQSGMQRFHQALREASSVADFNAKSIAGAFFKAQVEIVGGFAAIGTAALGLIDKVAMADQQYRLFALHMYMSKDAARSLKIAMDALGEPLENLTWDKELRERTHQLIQDQRAMAPEGDFEAEMRKVRDIRFEFTRMEVELQYLGMHVVNDFLRALGVGPDTLLTKLRSINDWVTHNLPEISNKVVSIFLPVWHDVVDVFSAVRDAAAAAGLAFTNLVGALSGDSSIEGQTFDLKKFALALSDVIHFLAGVAQAFAKVAQFISEAVAVIGEVLSHIPAPILNAAIGAVVGGVTAGPMGAVVGAGAGALLSIPHAMHPDSVPSVGTTPGSAHDLVSRYAAQFGVDPGLAHALATQESGERQVDANGNIITSSSGALGIMQLTRGTAAALGVDRSNADENVKGGMQLFAHLLQQYGNAATAVAAYHEGAPKMNAILAGKATLSPEAREEVRRVMASTGATGDVQIGSMIINIDKPNAVNADVGNAVVAQLRTTRDKTVQRNLAEFNGESWSY